MSVEDKVAELEQKMLDYQRLCVDRDVTLVKMLLNKDVRFVAGLTEQQKKLVVSLDEDQAMYMTNIVRPEFFGLYVGMMHEFTVGFDDIVNYMPARTIVEWWQLSNNERGFLGHNFPPKVIGAIVRNFDIDDPVVGSYSRWYAGNVKYPYLEEDFLVKFMKWFHDVEEKQSLMEDFSEFSMYARVSDKEVLETAMENPLLLKAGRKYIEACVESRGFNLSSDMVYDFVRDEKSSQSLLDYQGGVGVWAELCEGTEGWSVELENADLEKAGEVYERLLVAEYEREDRHLYLEGLKQNIKSGTAREYCDYILTEMNKGVIGGGNYRQVFARKAV